MDEMEEHFACYWSDLQWLAKKHGERVFDRDAWREPFDAGKNAEQAFYDEFPEHTELLYGCVKEKR